MKDNMPTVDMKIAVIRLCKKSELSPEDLGLDGVYVATVQKNLAKSIKARAAILRFHEAQAIDNLDNFELVVFDEKTGVVIDQADLPDEESLAEACTSVEKISDDRLHLYETTMKDKPIRLVASSKKKALNATLQLLKKDIFVKKLN